MRPETGHTVQWRRGSNGRMMQMVVDFVHEEEGERWLFSRLAPNGTWTAVNQKFVLGVK